MTDHTAAPRPVPTFADRTATDAPLPTWLPDALEELRAARAELAKERSKLDDARYTVDQVLAKRDEALEARDVARQLAAFRKGVIDRHRQELGAAGDVLAVVRDAVERIDRAIATYDTTPGEAPPSSVPPRRAQEEPASEEVRWAYRWLDADGNVLDEMDTRDNVRETAEARAHRLAANRPPSIPRGDVVRYRVVTTAEVVATYPPQPTP